MKKQIFFLLFFTGIVNAQIVNIPDANFKNKLIALGVDTNSDGNIQQAEALAVTSLNVSDSSIASLVGIESFTNLTYLDCLNNHYISSLNLTNLTNLTYLNCSRNNLTSLNVSMLTNLTYLSCYTNNINALDVTPLVSLTYLDCAENHIQVLNVANLTNLTYLGCASNNVSVLTVDNLINLTTLYCGGNNISTLNVGQLVNLDKLQCFSNNITSLNLAPLTNLTLLFCNSNPIASLNLNGLTNLNRLNCGSPQLLELDVSSLVNLETLTIYGGQFPNIDLSSLVNLRGFTMLGSNHLLTSVDISHSPLLYEFRLLGTTTVHYLNLKNGGVLSSMHLSDTSNIYGVCCNQADLSNITFALSFTNTSLIANVNTDCLFFPYDNYNTITGNVIFDADNNGCDSNDSYQSYVRMNISNGVNQGAVYTNLQGNYAFFTQNGNYTITPNIENPTYFNFSPPNAIVNFSNDENNTVNHNFCMSVNAVHNDLEIAIVPLTTARPGFDVTYKVVYKNKGNQTLSGDINFTYEDDVMDYVSSSLAINTQSFGNLNWTYTNMHPFETRSFTVVFNVNSPVETPAVNIGDQLDLGVNINPVVGDDLSADNEFGFKHIVVGSLDPNDKTCLEGSIVSPTSIGGYLHYNINFENTGNFQAENIVVKDMIDATKFDINSLQILNASHPMVTRVVGNRVEFVFENINLAAQGHGNVTFKIKTKNTLVTGNTVTNKADIYFDYNAPVITNIASTTFQTLNVGENQIDNTVKIYPNPASDFVQIEANSSIKSIQLFDAQGRVLTTKIPDNIQANMDISTYQNGIYFLKVKTETGIKVEKIVKE